MKNCFPIRSIAIALTAGVALAACGSETESTESASTESSDGFPLTTQNCGNDVTFDEPPQRIMLLESAPVTILDGINVFDRVSSRAGSYPDEYYDDELAAAVDEVPALTDELDASGHLMISQEEIIAEEPDLVLGLPDGVSRATLGDAGINVLEQELYCPDSAEEASFETLYDEIERYGEIFDHQDEAAELQSDLEGRVTDVEDIAFDDSIQTAAVLYPSEGGGPLYTYGTGSMAQPQLDALGLENVFGESSERVFEVQTEKIIDADPDVIVLLYQGDEEGIYDSIASIPGAESMTAFEEDRVFTQLFNFTEPASPLNVTGLEHLADELAESDAS